MEETSVFDFLWEAICKALHKKKRKKENGAIRGREIVVGMHHTHVGHLESTGEIVEVWWTWVNDPDRNS